MSWQMFSVVLDGKEVNVKNKSTYYYLLFKHFLSCLQAFLTEEKQETSQLNQHTPQALVQTDNNVRIRTKMNRIF